MLNKGDLVISTVQPYLGPALVLQTYGVRRCKVYWIKSGFENLMVTSSLCKIGMENQ